jgi:hypothetical protein
MENHIYIIIGISLPNAGYIQYYCLREFPNIQHGYTYSDQHPLILDGTENIRQQAVNVCETLMPPG